MEPSTKKRKEPPPNRTLLEFFSRTDAIKRARVKMSQLLAPSERQTKVASREIIVLGSDSDEGNGARLDPNTRVSEDFQFLTPVTSTPKSTEDLGAFGVPSALLRPPNPCVESSSNRSHTQQPSTSSEPDQSESMFGVPTLLLEKTSNSSYFWFFVDPGWS